jgi:hypothetical protein
MDSGSAGDVGGMRVLVLRAWVEPPAPGLPPRLRARLLELRPGRDPRSLLTTTSVEEACQAVRGWLESLGGAANSGGGDAAVTRRGSNSGQTG